jgi:hypothetical protein
MWTGASGGDGGRGRVCIIVSTLILHGFCQVEMSESQPHIVEWQASSLSSCLLNIHADLLMKANDTQHVQVDVGTLSVGSNYQDPYKIDLPATRWIAEVPC